MSTPTEKTRAATRRHRDETHVARQLEIAKQHSVGVNSNDIREPHRMIKRHAMDCGVSRCPLCSSPRSLSGELSIQEQRFYQDVDAVRDRHSNGLLPDDKE